MPSPDTSLRYYVRVLIQQAQAAYPVLLPGMHGVCSERDLEDIVVMASDLRDAAEDVLGGARAMLRDRRGREGSPHDHEDEE